jgi:hypothetical protein
MYEEMGMNLQIALNAIDGLALFLLAILMMTEELKVFAVGGHPQLSGANFAVPACGSASVPGRADLDLF